MLLPDEHPYTVLTYNIMHALTVIILTFKYNRHQTKFCNYTVVRVCELHKNTINTNSLRTETSPSAHENVASSISIQFSSEIKK